MTLRRLTASLAAVSLTLLVAPCSRCEGRRDWFSRGRHPSERRSLR